MIKIRLNLRKVVAIAICLAGMTTMTAQNADIYAAGGVGGLGKVWKNNVELYSVADGINDVSFNCIYVSGNDVYTGATISTNINGWEYHPIIWKNGKLLYELETTDNFGFIDDIYVSGGDVYACGSENSHASNAVVWKNGKLVYTLCEGYYNKSTDYLYYYANTIQVIGNDVYVAGYSSGSNNNSHPGWCCKNETVLYSIGGASFNDIVVSKNDVYIAGSGLNSSGIQVPKVWKNGVELYSEENGDFRSINILGNDVYVSGYKRIVAKDVATVWKNGTVFNQLIASTDDTNGITGARANDIWVINNDVYVLTNYRYISQSIIWKNNAELYKMVNQSVNTLFVLSPNNANIDNIEIHNLQIYPNPVKNELFIQSKTDIDRIEIYSIAGKQMFSVNLTDAKSINVSELPTGIYVLKIGDYTEKFIKE